MGFSDLLSATDLSTRFWFLLWFWSQTSQTRSNIRHCDLRYCGLAAWRYFDENTTVGIVVTPNRIFLIPSADCTVLRIKLGTRHARPKPRKPLQGTVRQNHLCSLTIVLSSVFSVILAAQDRKLRPTPSVVVPGKMWGSCVWG